MGGRVGFVGSFGRNLPEQQREIIIIIIIFQSQIESDFIFRPQSLSLVVCPFVCLSCWLTGLELSEKWANFQTHTQAGQTGEANKFFAPNLQLRWPRVPFGLQRQHTVSGRRLGRCRNCCLSSSSESERQREREAKREAKRQAGKEEEEKNRREKFCPCDRCEKAEFELCASVQSSVQSECVSVGVLECSVQTVCRIQCVALTTEKLLQEAADCSVPCAVWAPVCCLCVALRTVHCALCFVQSKAADCVRHTVCNTQSPAHSLPHTVCRTQSLLVCLRSPLTSGRRLSRAHKARQPSSGRPTKSART